MTSFLLKIAGVLVAVAISFSFVGAYKSTSTVQRGYQGVGMEVNEKTFSGRITRIPSRDVDLTDMKPSPRSWPHRERRVFAREAGAQNGARAVR